MIIHFLSMDAFKTNLQPTFVLYRSPDLLRYVQEADPSPAKALEPVKTSEAERVGPTEELGWRE
jgi:hypothetical protein